MIKTNLFADQEREAELNQLGDALQIMEQYVDFAALAAEVDLAAPLPSRERSGRPPFPTELMVRVLLIQQLFNLSDEQMEFQLPDHLSFQRFVGLRASSQIPDRTTIWTFKERLIQAGASESMFDAVNHQLSRMQPHWERTAARMQQHAVVLCIADTTERDFNSQDMEGLGPFSFEAQRGMYLHPTYAVTPDREPLGILDAWMWARETLDENGRRGGIKESTR